MVRPCGAGRAATSRPWWRARGGAGDGARGVAAEAVGQQPFRAIDSSGSVSPEIAFRPGHVAVEVVHRVVPNELPSVSWRAGSVSDPEEGANAGNRPPVALRSLSLACAPRSQHDRGVSGSAGQLSSVSGRGACRRRRSGDAHSTKARPRHGLSAGPAAAPGPGRDGGRGPGSPAAGGRRRRRRRNGGRTPPGRERPRPRRAASGRGRPGLRGAALAGRGGGRKPRRSFRAPRSRGCGCSRRGRRVGGVGQRSRRLEDERGCGTQRGTRPGPEQYVTERSIPSARYVLLWVSGSEHQLQPLSLRGHHRPNRSGPSRDGRPIVRACIARR